MDPADISNHDLQFGGKEKDNDKEVGDSLKIREDIIKLHDLMIIATNRLSKENLEILDKYKAWWDYEINSVLTQNYIIRMSALELYGVVLSLNELGQKASQFIDKIIKTINSMDKIFNMYDTSKIPDKLVVYKGISKNKITNFTSVGALPKKREPKIGDKIKFFSYMSTSLEYGVASLFKGDDPCCIYRISIDLNKLNDRKGLLYLEYNNHNFLSVKFMWASSVVYGSEYELLIDRGCIMQLTGKSQKDIQLKYAKIQQITVYDFDLIGFDRDKVKSPTISDISFLVKS